MLGGLLLSLALVLGQEFLEKGCRKSEGLPTKAHQVCVLQPGVIEAVLDGWTSPFQEKTQTQLKGY